MEKRRTKITVTKSVAKILIPHILPVLIAIYYKGTKFHVQLYQRQHKHQKEMKKIHSLCSTTIGCSISSGILFEILGWLCQKNKIFASRDFSEPKINLQHVKGIHQVRSSLWCEHFGRLKFSHAHFALGIEKHDLTSKSCSLKFYLTQKPLLLIQIQNWIILNRST